MLTKFQDSRINTFENMDIQSWRSVQITDIDKK
jgi:hypothetical protein